MKKQLNPQEHQVWLTVYNTSLGARLAKPEQGVTSIVMRKGDRPNPHAEAANGALEAYRKACAG